MPDHLLSAAACAEIAARAAKATAGPWVECRPGQPCPQIFAGVKKLGEILREPDMVFVLNAREEIPALLATVAALRPYLKFLAEAKPFLEVVVGMLRSQQALIHNSGGHSYEIGQQAAQCEALIVQAERATAIYAETGP